MALVDPICNGNYYTAICGISTMVEKHSMNMTKDIVGILYFDQVLYVCEKDPLSFSFYYINKIFLCL